MNFRILPSARLEMLDAFDFYESKKDGLGDRFIVAVAHPSRRPGYWLRRWKRQ